MVFDELHDPQPPEPGIREFAIVAERAQAIRRRRAAWVVRVASVFLVVGAVGSLYLLANRTETTPSGPPVATPAPRSEATGPPATQPAPASTVGLTAAQSASALPPIELGPGLLTISDEPLVEIFEATDGRTCVQTSVAISTANCAPAGAGFVVIDYGEGAARRVALVVDPTIDVGFDDSSATCSRTFPDFAVVQVVVCSGLDLATATVEVPGPDRLVIHP
jgi:hypothetical protein